MSLDSVHLNLRAAESSRKSFSNVVSAIQIHADGLIEDDEEVIQVQNNLTGMCLD